MPGRDFEKRIKELVWKDHDTEDEFEDLETCDDSDNDPDFVIVEKEHDENGKNVVAETESDSDDDNNELLESETIYFSVKALGNESDNQCFHKQNMYKCNTKEPP